MIYVMNRQTSNSDPFPPLLFLIDDGWRYEKRQIIRYLREYIPLKLLTHDRQTYDKFRREYDIQLLPLYPVRRHKLYAPSMFFARELDTVLTRRYRAYWLQMQPPGVRLLHRFREWAKHLGLRRFDYSQTLGWLYRNSRCYSDQLRGHRVLVYNPALVTDKRILFEARAAGLRIVSWVYSWDNPLKDNEFLRNADAYLVWNEDCRQDLILFHGIPADRVHITGPSQMDYLRGQPPSPSAATSRRYVLYPCATGKMVFAVQEVAFIISLRDLLDAIDPEVELVIRPYPFRSDFQQNVYSPLEGRKGIFVEYFGKIEGRRLVIDAQIEHERYLQFRDALCMINMGSTIGLEAAFTRTPILQLAFCDVPAPSPELALSRIFDHEHLKYLIDRRFPNVVNNRAELEHCLRRILSGKTEIYQAYSEKLRCFVDPLNADSYKQVLADKLIQLASEWSREQ